MEEAKRLTIEISEGAYEIIKEFCYFLGNTPFSYISSVVEEEAKRIKDSPTSIINLDSSNKICSNSKERKSSVSNKRGRRKQYL